MATNNDIVNIPLARPKPISFDLGDGVTLTISGRISMGDALDVNNLVTELQVAETGMYARLGEVASADAATADLSEIQASLADAAKGFDDAVNALSEKQLELFRVNHPDLAELPYGADAALIIGQVIWRRAFGATDDELKRLGEAAQSEDGDPPTRPKPPARSTSRNGSTASAKRTGGRPTAGSKPR